MLSPVFKRLLTALGVCLSLVGLWTSSLKAQPVVKPTVVTTYPHDVRAFTQGLLLTDGALLESTGLRGRSSLRRVEVNTGEVTQQVDLERQYFGEGLALAGDRLIQLTWQSGVAFAYDADSFEQLGTFDYVGEGWGLCFDGKRLVMSNGSGKLAFRDPTTFEVQGDVSVTRGGTPANRLNELECVGSLVYANVWQTNDILRIDPKTGETLTRIDASDLKAEQRAGDVLNGIAYNPSNERFFLTGKLWNKVYEVSFPFAAGATSSDAGGVRTDAASTEGPSSSTRAGNCDCATAPSQWGLSSWPLAALLLAWLRRVDLF